MYIMSLDVYLKVVTSSYNQQEEVAITGAVHQQLPEFTDTSAARTTELLG